MTDWRSLIGGLLDSGLTRPGIAHACGAGVATINDLARGTTREPRHALGEALLALHAQHCIGKRRRAGKKKG